METNETPLDPPLASHLYAYGKNFANCNFFTNVVYMVKHVNKVNMKYKSEH